MSDSSETRAVAAAVSEHTSGRLSVRKLDDFTGMTELTDGAMPIAKAYRNNNQPVAEANARRLCAAWNACSVFTTEELEAQSQEQLFDGLQSQIRELREALRLITRLPTIGGISKGERKGLEIAAENARALLEARK